MIMRFVSGDHSFFLMFKMWNAIKFVFLNCQELKVIQKIVGKCGKLCGLCITRSK